ncbi:hypothetical protein PALI_a0437 [Pseudoalteromonas aliena SW19]|uniref:Uncharacterized protein n=1 Tax=Pseudoalteromonas aliena SW19 TaxID=1314866 RepID=A0ABR9DXY1_9GAMM|nr:hypothetical protein [Pseudoalteromonas aliena SW19]
MHAYHGAYVDDEVHSLYSIAAIHNKPKAKQQIQVQTNVG